MLERLSPRKMLPVPLASTTGELRVPVLTVTGKFPPASVGVLMNTPVTEYKCSWSSPTYKSIGIVVNEGS